jgi:hypothetical protein
MRTVTVNGASGIIVARGMANNAGKVFVLFDGDNVSESLADWVDVDNVTVTGTVPLTI